MYLKRVKKRVDSPKINCVWGKNEGDMSEKRGEPDGLTYHMNITLEKIEDIPLLWLGRGGSKMAQSRKGKGKGGAYEAANLLWSGDGGEGGSFRVALHHLVRS